MRLASLQEQEADELVTRTVRMFMTSKNAEQRSVARAYAARALVVLAFNQRHKALARLESALQGRK